MNLFSTVASRYPKKVPCPLALVAGFPGIDDLCSGKALTGFKGHLLNKALRLANIDRKELFIGYLVDRRIPEDDIRSIGLRKWESADYYDGATPRKMPGVGFMPPTFWDDCDRLAGELEKTSPAIIVPMGVFATWAFTEQMALRKARGSVDRARFISPGTKILPTFDPGYIHRQYKFLGTWVNDFQKAWLEAGRSPLVVSRTRRQLWVAPTLQDLETFYADFLVRADCITVDIETAKGQITDISFGASAKLAIQVPFVDYRQPNRCYWHTPDEELAAWDWVKQVLDLPTPKLFQNGPYDCFYLVRWGFRVRNYCRDARLLHHAYAPELPKDLAYMASVYCEEGPWKLLVDHARAEEKLDDKRDN